MGSMDQKQALFTLPQLVTEHATKTPGDTFATVPKTSDLKQGWRNITFQELSCAVDGMARWIERHVSPLEPGQVLTYMGLNDIRYPVALVATMKTGATLMLPSLRNSLEGQVSLLEKTECSIVFHSEMVDTAVDPIKSSRPKTRFLQIPSFDELVHEGISGDPYPYHGTGAENEKVLVLNTSGSTGLPKPIYVTNGAITTLHYQTEHPVAPGRKNALELWKSKGSFFTMMPFFHAIGCVIVFRSLLWGVPLVLMPAGRPVTVDVVIDVFKDTKPASAMIAPSMLEEISDIEDGLNALTNTEHVYFGGAPLGFGAGERINQFTHLFNLLGSTEGWVMPTLANEDRKDWNYLEWTPNSGMEMEPVGDGLCELVIKQDNNRHVQAVFHTFPDLQEWRTKDLFEQHPKKPGLWRFAGRRDDIIVLSNGEKFSPVDLEKYIENDPLVEGALVVGQGHFQAGLIVEPRWDKLDTSIEPDAILEKIYPAVEKANEAMPTHGQIWKSRIGIAHRDKPFKRASKGSMMRRATEKLYEQEINALYAQEGFGEELGTLEDTSSVEGIETFLRKACKLTMPNFSEEAASDADFFSFGVDSLQVMGLSSALNHALSTGKDSPISPRDVYNHPSVRALAHHIHNRGKPSDSDEQDKKRAEGLSQMVEDFTVDLPSRSPAPVATYPEQHTVILTGSTGSLGNYILQELIKSDHVAKVYCLNRSADAETRQRQSFESRSVTADFSKVSFLQASFGEARFGLSESVFDDLLQSVDILIHNAWAVDFNKSLSSYRDVHVSGVRRCVDFSIRSTRRTHIVFISSIAGLGNWASVRPNDREAAEKIFEDGLLTSPSGYGESKHVSERILNVAAHRSGVPITIVRSGQLAGSSSGDGVWNTHEWLPSIVATSKALKIVPQTLGNQNRVDWVPTDLAAQLVLDLTLSRASSISASKQLVGVYHLANPQTTTWTQLIPALQKFYGEMKEVSFEEWLEELGKMELTAEQAQKLPALKLIDFFQSMRSNRPGLPILATVLTTRDSRTARQLEAVDEEMITRWLEQWQF